MHQAIPTQYKGIRFRSKSEAIFARAMDQIDESGPYQIKWRYEPQEFSLDGYSPDFWAEVCLHPRTKTKNRENFRSALLIEYKPTDITETYKQRLKDWHGRNGLIMPLMIFCRSPYEINKGSSIVCILPNEWEGDVARIARAMMMLLTSDILGEMAAAKRFRFDLEYAEMEAS